MKNISILFFGILFLSLCFIAVQAGEQKMLPKNPSLTLEKMAIKIKDQTVFGDSVKKQILQTAAIEFRKGTINKKSVEFNILVKVTELPPKYGNLPDACFETCLGYGRSTAVQCYVDCNAPKP